MCISYTPTWLAKLQSLAQPQPPQTYLPSEPTIALLSRLENSIEILEPDIYVSARAVVYALASLKHPRLTTLKRTLRPLPYPSSFLLQYGFWTIFIKFCQNATSYVSAHWCTDHYVSNNFLRVTYKYIKSKLRREPRSRVYNH